MRQALSALFEPTFQFLSASKPIAFKLLQMLPLFILSSVLAWALIAVVHLARHPELIVDAGFGILASVPSYCDYAARRILARLSEKVSDPFSLDPSNTELGTPAFGTP